MNNLRLKIETEVLIGLTDIDDIMCSAIEGGIGYWACLDNSTEEFKSAPAEESYSETSARLLKEGKSVFLIDEEEDERFELTLDKLIAGLKKYLEDPDKPYEIIDKTYDGLELDCGMVDADVADMIVQYALFGEVLYG